MMLQTKNLGLGAGGTHTSVSTQQGRALSPTQTLKITIPDNRMRDGREKMRN